MDGVIDTVGAFKSTNVPSDLINSCVTTGAAVTGADVGTAVTGVAEGPVV